MKTLAFRRPVSGLWIDRNLPFSGININKNAAKPEKIDSHWGIMPQLMHQLIAQTH
tara:strand:- start:38665 stop:38832 length:168 start_codon:yes stop_codon:yes gene_type:complete